MDKTQDQIMDQRTIFRHGVKTSEDLMDIINYLESEFPGTRVQVAEAIRYAIGNQARKIRTLTEVRNGKNN